MLAADKPSTHAFCPKVGTIKDRNGRDLVNVEEIKKRREEYTEELFKKDLNEPDNCDGVVSHPEPDILESEVKRALKALLSTKLVEVLEFQESYSKP